MSRRQQTTKKPQTKRPTLEDPEQVEYRRILDELVKLPENKVCADCKKASPKWASATLGVFLCMDCAGHHRSLGVHISFIRSTSMDIWESEYIENMKNIGNEKSNEIYEANLNENQRPRWGDKTGLSNFIREKYSERRFCERGQDKVKKNNTKTQKKEIEKEPEPEPEPEQNNFTMLFETKPKQQQTEPQNQGFGFEEIFTKSPPNNNQNDEQTRQNIKENIMKMFEPQSGNQNQNNNMFVGGQQNQGLNQQNQGFNQQQQNQGFNQGFNQQNQGLNQQKQQNFGGNTQGLFMNQNLQQNQGFNQQNQGFNQQNQINGGFNNQGFNQGYNQQQGFNQQNQGFNGFNQQQNFNGGFNNQQQNQGFNQGYNQQQGFNQQQKQQMNFNTGGNNQFNQGFNQGYNQQQGFNQQKQQMNLNGGNNQGFMNQNQQNPYTPPKTSLFS